MSPDLSDFAWLRPRIHWDLSLTVDPRMRVLGVSESVTRTLGAPRERVIGSTLAEWCHPEDLQGVREVLLRLKMEPHPGSLPVQLRLRSSSGSCPPMEGRVACHSRRPTDAEVMIRARVGCLGALECDSREASEDAGGECGVAVAFTDIRGKLLNVNRCLLELWGFDHRQRIAGRPLSILVEPGGWGLDASWSLSQRGSWSGELIARRCDDRRFHARASAAVLRRDDGTVAGMVFAFRNASHQVRMERDLRRDSMRDDLTGLYNRRGFRLLAGEQLRVARAARAQVGLLYVDVDCLKWVNDNLGHEEGDGLLTGVADLLRTTFRNAGLLGRIGGDEFGVFLIGRTCEHRSAYIRDLSRRVKRHNRLRSAGPDISVSVGEVCVGVESRDGINGLLVAAEREMYAGRRDRRNASLIESPWLEAVERRRYRRRVYSAPRGVRLLSAGGLPAEAPVEEVRCRLVDVGLDGAQIACSSARDPGSEVLVHLDELGGTKHPLDAVVIWCSRAGTDGKFNVGVRFSPSARRRIGALYRRRSLCASLTAE